MLYIFTNAVFLTLICLILQLPAPCNSDLCNGFFFEMMVVTQVVNKFLPVELKADLVFTTACHCTLSITISPSICKIVASQIYFNVILSSIFI